MEPGVPSASNPFSATRRAELTPPRFFSRFRGCGCAIHTYHWVTTSSAAVGNEIGPQRRCIEHSPLVAPAIESYLRLTCNYFHRPLARSLPATTPSTRSAHSVDATFSFGFSSPRPATVLRIGAEAAFGKCSAFVGPPPGLALRSEPQSGQLLEIQKHRGGQISPVISTRNVLFKACTVRALASAPFLHARAKPAVQFQRIGHIANRIDAGILRS